MSFNAAQQLLSMTRRQETIQSQLRLPQEESRRSRQNHSLMRRYPIFGRWTMVEQSLSKAAIPKYLLPEKMHSHQDI
jgi:hypothetical protein